MGAPSAVTYIDWPSQIPKYSLPEPAARPSTALVAAANRWMSRDLESSHRRRVLASFVLRPSPVSRRRRVVAEPSELSGYGDFPAFGPMAVRSRGGFQVDAVLFSCSGLV